MHPKDSARALGMGGRMWPVLTGVAHYETTCRATIDGKPLGPHMSEEQADVVRWWLRRLTWPEMETVLAHIPTPRADKESDEPTGQAEQTMSGARMVRDLAEEIDNEQCEREARADQARRTWNRAR